MKGARYRSWYFNHPDFAPSPQVSAENASAGLQISSTGGIAMVEDDDAIRQSLLLLLSTAPGERVMRPEYGCHLNRLVFSRADQSTAGLAIHYVRQAITRWEPRVDITHVDASAASNDAGRLIIELGYVVKPFQRQNQLSLAINLTGEMT
jgi:uncharacterized protein